MTNFEKYKDDILKIDGDIAFDKVQRKVVRCHKCNCKDCEFDEKCFESNKIKWLYEEYKPPVLSDDELDLIQSLNKAMDKEYKYIARNGNRVFLFPNKPSMDKYGIRFTDKCDYLIISEHRKSIGLFSSIKYEDGLYDIQHKCFIKE